MAARCCDTWPRRSAPRADRRCARKLPLPGGSFWPPGRHPQSDAVAAWPADETSRPIQVAVSMTTVQPAGCRRTLRDERVPQEPRLPGEQCGNPRLTRTASRLRNIYELAKDIRTRYRSGCFSQRPNRRASPAAQRGWRSQARLAVARGAGAHRRFPIPDSRGRSRSGRLGKSECRGTSIARKRERSGGS